MPQSANRQSGSFIGTSAAVIAGLLFALGLLILSRSEVDRGFLPLLGIATVGGLIAAIPLRSFALLCEFTLLPIVQWLCLKWGVEDPAVLHVCTIACVAVCLAYKLSSRGWAIAAWMSVFLWFFLTLQSPLSQIGALDVALLCSAVVALVVGTWLLFLGNLPPVRKLDVILCSHSGNTAHFTEPFLRAVRREGAETLVHRFHYYRRFQAELTGDALAVAFPVIGWKPPWPLFNYLLFRLPWGRGKRAFVIYTSAGGPENAGAVTWLLLTLRGYRVMGRASAVYPFNLPTVRLGPARLWRWLDSLMPWRATLDAQARAGRDFAQGRAAGLPILFWPGPLFLFGIAVDNQVVDRLCRNHVFRRRCNRCGICVKFCPAERLRMVNGRPKAEGTCTLCFGCVNHCPTRAMQMWLLTEYGNPYRARWTNHIADPSAEIARQADDSRQ
jgi:ferredoxin